MNGPLLRLSFNFFFTFRLSSPQEILKSADFVRPGIFYFNIIPTVGDPNTEHIQTSDILWSRFELYDHLKTEQNVQFSNGGSHFVFTI